MWGYLYGIFDCAKLRFRLGFASMKLLLGLLLNMGLSAQALEPAWFSDHIKSYPECETTYLCALGEAETRAEALSVARLEIAKFFQNKIESKSIVQSTSEQKSLNASSANFSEWTNKTINEETSEIINGLEIKKEEQGKERSYLLMALNKDISAKIFRMKIEELDTENVQLIELNSRFAYPKIMRNLVLIQALNERYYLLSSKAIIQKIRKEKLQEKINKLIPIKMALLSASKKLPSKLNHVIVDLLSSLKVVIVSRKAYPKYTLRTELSTEEQYLKVEGFKKLNVQFKLEVFNSKMEPMGKLSAVSEQLARNSDQAIDLALPDIKTELQNNLDQISSIKIED